MYRKSDEGHFSFCFKSLSYSPNFALLHKQIDGITDLIDMKLKIHL